MPLGAVVELVNFLQDVHQGMGEIIHKRVEFEDFGHFAMPLSVYLDQPVAE
jgi:hypothetical protein